jgi:DNA polymerase III subunit epsilon
MREIVFDTETTGTRPDLGDRVVEIGMVELMDLVPTGRTFHRYINPQRDMPDGAFRVHGLSEQFLSQFKTFDDPSIVDELLEFVGDGVLVAHNAEFDRGFLNAELARLNLAPIPQSRVVDTLVLARKKFPGAPNSLDALCRRFSIDLSVRDKHGALLDSKLLAAVYLELKGGRERRLAFLDPPDETKAAEGAHDGAVASAAPASARRQRPAPLASRLTEAEAAAHAAFLATLGAQPVWDRYPA